MDNKIYTPSTITDQPFPQAVLDSSNNVVSSGGANQIYSPTTIQDTGLPIPHIATETISDTLNTKTRKIIKEYQFAPSGALQIGDFTQGVSGDLRISPDGIIARNITGDTTFALDGDTGDATFSGKVKGGSIQIGDNFTVDEEGNFSALSGNVLTYRRSFIATTVLLGREHGISLAGTIAQVISSTNCDKIRVIINNVQYTFSIPVTASLPSGSVPANTFAAFLVVVDTSGNVSLVASPNDFTTGYVSAATAIADLPATPVNKKAINYCGFKAGGSPFVMGTSNFGDVGASIFTSDWQYVLCTDATNSGLGGNIYYAGSSTYSLISNFSDINLGSETYAYFDPTISKTQVQYSGNPTDAIGLTKILLNILTGQFINGVLQMYTLNCIQG